MKTNKRTYLLAALLLISLASALPIDPLSGSGNLQSTTSTLAKTVETASSSIPLALFAAAAAALLFYQQASKPQYTTDGKTYRIDSAGRLYLPTGGGWTQATFSSDASYLQYLRTAVSSSASDKVAVRGSDDKWTLASKSSVSSYLSMLDSSQSKLTALQKDVVGARIRFLRAKAQSATSWMTRSAAHVYDKLLEGIAAAKSSISGLTSWLSDLTKFGESSKYGFKYSGRTYTYSSSGLHSIEAQSAYTRFKEDATAASSSFSSEISALYSGYSSHAAALGWSGLDLMKQRLKEIYQQHLAEVGAASQEFAADYVKRSDWKHADEKRRDLSTELRDDMKALYEKYLEKLDKLAYDQLVSAEQKAAIAAEEARRKQEEQWRAQSFWDRNYKKIMEKLKLNRAKQLAALSALPASLRSQVYEGGATLAVAGSSQKIIDVTGLTTEQAIQRTYFASVSAVDSLVDHNKGSKEFDEFYYGTYRPSIGRFEYLTDSSANVDYIVSVMNLLDESVKAGDLSVQQNLQALSGLMSQLRVTDEGAYRWFSENIYSSWSQKFDSAYSTAAEKRREEVTKAIDAQEAASESFSLAQRMMSVLLGIQSKVSALQQQKQIEEFGWGQYDPNNPSGVCVAQPTSLSSVGGESYLSDSGYLDAKKMYDFLDGLDRWIYKDLGGKAVDDFVHSIEGGAEDVGEAIWAPIKALGEDVYDAAKPYAAAAYYLSSFGRISEDFASDGMDYWARLGGVFGQRILDTSSGLYDLAKLIGFSNPVSAAKLGSGIGLSFAPEVIYIRDHPQETASAIKSDFASRIQLIQDSWSQLFSIQNPPKSVDAAIDQGAARGFGLFGLRPGDTDLLTSLFGIRDDLAEKRFDEAGTKLAADVIFFSALSKILGLGGKTATAGKTFSKAELLTILPEEQVLKIERLGLNKIGIQQVIETGGIKQLSYAIQTYDDFVLKDMFEYASTAVKEFRPSQAVRVTTQTNPTVLTEFGKPTEGFFVVDSDVLRGLDLTRIEDVMRLEGRLGKPSGSLVNELKISGELRVYQIPESAKYTIPSEGDIYLGIPGSGITVGGAPERFVEGLMDLTKLDYTLYTPK